MGLHDAKKKLGLEELSDDELRYAFRTQYPQLSELQDDELDFALDQHYMGRGTRFRRAMGTGVRNAGLAFDQAINAMAKAGLQGTGGASVQQGGIDTAGEKPVEWGGNILKDANLERPAAKDWKDTLIDMAGQELIEIPAEMAIERLAGLPPGYSKLSKLGKIGVRAGRNAIVGAGVAQMRPYETAGERAIGTAMSAGAYGLFALPKIGSTAIGAGIGAAVDREQPGRGAAIGGAAGLGGPTVLRRLLKRGAKVNLGGEEVDLPAGLLPEQAGPDAYGTGAPVGPVRGLISRVSPDDAIITADPSMPQYGNLLYEEASRYGVPLRYGADPTSGGWKSVDFLRDEVAQAKLRRGKGRVGGADASRVSSEAATPVPRRMRLPEGERPAGLLTRGAIVTPEPGQSGGTYPFDADALIKELQDMAFEGSPSDATAVRRLMPQDVKGVGTVEQGEGAQAAMAAYRNLQVPQRKAAFEAMDAARKLDDPIQQLNRYGEYVGSGAYGRTIPQGPRPKKAYELSPEYRKAVREPNEWQQEASRLGINTIKDDGTPFSDQYLRMRIGSKKKIQAKPKIEQKLTLAQWVRRQGGIKPAKDYNTRELQQDIGINIIRKSGMGADDLAKIAREEGGFDVKNGDALIEKLKEDRFKLRHGGGQVGDEFSRYEADIEQAGAAEEARFAQDVVKASKRWPMQAEDVPESNIAKNMDEGDVVRLPGDDDVYQVLENDVVEGRVRVKDGVEKILENNAPVEKIGKTEVESPKVKGKKEAWEMTADEFVAENAIDFPGQEAQLRAMHRKAVERAIGEGKAVPDGVKESYQQSAGGSLENQEAMTEEEYLASKGASKLGYGDSALHKNIPEGRPRKQLLDRQLKLDEELSQKRDVLRKKYKDKVKSGELREPTQTERLIRTAQGHPDNEAVQAARRLLKKRGVNWETGEKLPSTRIEKTAAGEQIVDKALRPQAEMPMGKIGKTSEPIEGRGGVGMFAEKTPEVDQADLFSGKSKVESQKSNELPPKVQRILDKKKASVKSQEVESVSKAGTLTDNSGNIKPGKANAVQQTIDMGESAQNPQVEKIEDFGEKIGMARKDVADRGYKMQGPQKDSVAAWRKRYQILDNDDGTFDVVRTRGSLKHNMHQIERYVQKGVKTKSEAEDLITIHAVSQKHRIYQDGKEWAIHRRIGSKLPKLIGGFKTEDEAREYLVLNAVEILNKKFEFYSRPHLERLERTGPDVRSGNISTSKYQDELGFRGGEFGNWLDNRERQDVLNKAYEAIHDMARVMGVSPKAISLNGELSVGFGSRGHGLASAAAHYEPERAVFNLTRFRGAGSMAHEWFHALDHYFARLAGKADTEMSGKAYKKTGHASDGFGYFPKVREELKQAFDDVKRTIFKKKNFVKANTDIKEKQYGKFADDIDKTLDAIRKHIDHDLSNEYKWKKRGNRAATKDELKTFDRIAKKIRNRDFGDLTTVPSNKGEWKKDYSYPEVIELSNLFKKIRGRSAWGDNQYMKELTNRINYFKRAKTELDALKETGGIEEKLLPTDFYKEARKLDEMRSAPYFTKNTEMMARAFEAFVHDALVESGQRNDYLVHSTSNEIYRALFDQAPYPEGAERKAINEAFKKFFSVLKEEPTEKGLKLYSKANPVGLAFGIERDEEGKYSYNPVKGLAGFVSLSVAPEMLRQTAKQWAKRGTSGIASGQDVVDSFLKYGTSLKNKASAFRFKARDVGRKVDDWFDAVAKTDFDKEVVRHAGNIGKEWENIRVDAEDLAKQLKVKTLANLARQKRPLKNVSTEMNAHASAASMVMEYGDEVLSPDFAKRVGNIKALWKRSVRVKDESITNLDNAVREAQRAVREMQSGVVDEKSMSPTMWLVKTLQDSYNELAMYAKDEGVLRKLRENYITHVWAPLDASGKKASQIRLRRAFKYAKERKIDDYLQGMEYGLLPSTMNAIELHKIYRKALTQTVWDRKFVNSLSGMLVDSPDGRFPMMVNQKTFDDMDVLEQRLYKTVDSPAFKRYFKGADGELHSQPYYVHEDVAKDIDKMFKRSSWADSELARKYNAVNQFYKRMKLALSGFHFDALGYNGLFQGGKKWYSFGNPLPFDVGGWKSLYKQGQAAIKSKDPVLGHLMEHGGLTLRETGAGQDYHSLANDAFTAFVKVHDKGLFEKIRKFDNNKGFKLFDKALWDQYFAGIKAGTAKVAYGRQLQTMQNVPKYKALYDDWARQGFPMNGKTEYEKIAAQKIARYQNDYNGGLNKEILKISAINWDRAKAMFLAPDWTVSNWRGTINSILELKRSGVKGSAEAQDLVKTVATLGLLGMLTNKAMTGVWPWENPRGTKNMVGVGPLGGDKNLYIDLYRHFGEPLKVWKWAGGKDKGLRAIYDAPMHYLLNKMSQGGRIIDMMVSGEDWRGRPLPTIDDIKKGKFYGDKWQSPYDRGSELPGVIFVAFGESLVPISVAEWNRVFHGDEPWQVGVGSVFGIHVKEEPTFRPQQGKKNSGYVAPKYNDRRSGRGRAGVKRGR